jgi:RHS repeat-associated protein
LLLRRAKSDGDTVLYLPGGNEIRLTVKGTTKTLSGTRYYTANAQTVAVRTAVSGASGTKLNFLAADHHGTSSVALDATTYAVTKRYSAPFGSPRGTKTSWLDDKGFLGKPADESTGLTHIGAREYDPAIGQFVNVDPIMVLDDPQTLNGYSYAGNSPVTHSDPTGLCRADQCGVGTPKGDGSGDIIRDGPIDPGNPSAGSCHKGSCGPIDYIDHGTAPTSSSGSTSGSGSNSSGPAFTCTGSGPMCVPNTGPGDSSSNAGNYLSSLLSNQDFWSGIIETIGGAFGSAGGGLLVVSGVVECGVGVLCVAGVPSMAGGAGLAVAGGGLIDSGSDKLGKAFREADGAASGGSSEAATQIGYGSSDLSRSVQLQRLIDNKKTGNYAAARLEDGTVLVGRSAKGIHAEEDLIQQANGRSIVDLYSEREPCANKCMGKVKGMSVTYTVPWNGVDRAASNATLKKEIDQLFSSP